MNVAGTSKGILKCFEALGMNQVENLGLNYLKVQPFKFVTMLGGLTRKAVALLLLLSSCTPHV